MGAGPLWESGEEQRLCASGCARDVLVRVTWHAVGLVCFWAAEAKPTEPLGAGVALYLFL